MGWISLVVAIVTGLTALATYLLGDKRKIRILQQRMVILENRLRFALAKNDTVAISSISIELERVRWELLHYSHGK